MPWAQHFEGFDPEGFSIWFCDYKYPEENTVNYIVMNKARACPPSLVSRTDVPAWAVRRSLLCVGRMHALGSGGRAHPSTPPQVGGFLQRIDYVRKYAFGVMCILKDDKGQFPIRCACIVSCH